MRGTMSADRRRWIGNPTAAADSAEEKLDVTARMATPVLDQTGAPGGGALPPVNIATSTGS